MAKSSWEGSGEAPPALQAAVKDTLQWHPHLCFSSILLPSPPAPRLPSSAPWAHQCAQLPLHPFLILHHFYKDSPAVGVELSAKLKAVS